MKTVRVIYRQEPDGAWIGTSPEIPGYVAHGDTYEQARARADDGLSWFAEQDLLIAHVVPDQGELTEGRPTRGRKVGFAITGAASRRVPYGHRFKEATEPSHK